MTPDQPLSPAEFVSFSQQIEPLNKANGSLSGQIATRLAAGDMASFFGLLPNPDPVLRAMGKQIPVYRNLLVDPLVMGARRRRAGAVLAMERGFDLEQSKRTPARVLKALEAAFAELDVQRIVRDLIDGAFFGYRVSEVMWGNKGGLVLPLDLIGKPSEWFGFEHEDVRLKFRPRMATQGVDVPDRKFVVVGKMRSWENPYGEADLAACFWPVTFKRGGFKFWMTFTEKYGMPWAVGKQPRQSGEKEANNLADKLAQMVRDAVAVIPDDSSVEFLTPSGSFNSDMYENLLMFCSREISIALLGNNQSVEMQSNKASAQAAHEVEKELRDDDAEMVAAGLNQLTRYICEVNWPGVVPPVYCFYEQEEVDDVLASRDQKLKQAGLNFTKAYWMRAYDLEDGDVGPDTPPGATQPGAGTGAPGAQVDAASFAERTGANTPAAITPPDQAAIDAAIEQLPAEAIQAAMKKMLTPALDAIAAAQSPDEVRQALLDAWPQMDATDLEELMGRAYFVADLVGQHGAADTGSP
jgi:phage gp29-like protein